MNASSRQDTPSTLSQWSSQSEEIPSYSKFTLGLSPSNFPSFLFPQQVVIGRIANPRTSFDKENRPVSSIPSSTPSCNKYNDSDMSFGSAGSAYDKQNDSATFTGSSTPSCSGKNTSLSMDSITHVDDFTTPPLDQRGRRFKNLHRPPVTPPSVKPIEPTVNALQLDRYKQKPQLNVAYHNIKHNVKYKNAAVASQAKQEASRRSDPNTVHSSPTTPMSQPSSRKDESLSSLESSPTSLYSLEDISDSDCPGSASKEDSPASPYRGERGGIKPPSFKLSAEFSDDPKYPVRSRTITGDEFYHFINGEALSAVMFYISGHQSEDKLKAWETNAEKESLDGERAFGTVDCATVPYLCLREHIPSVPFYKIYCEGYPIFSGTRMKMWKDVVVEH